MGCSNSSCSLQVTFESSTKEPTQPLTNYKVLRTWINTSFPNLSQKPYKIQLNTDPPVPIKNSQDYQQIYSKFSGKLHLQVLLEKPKRYRPDLFEKLTNWIFKVRKTNEDVEATGFMLSPRMCLVGIKSDHYSYHALFEDGSSLNFKENGVLVVIGEFSLIELQMTNDWISKHLALKQILLDPVDVPMKVVIFYYCRSRPILQEFVEDSFKSQDCDLIFNLKAASSCTAGAPVFGDNGKVVAVFESEGRAIRVSKIVQEIESILESLSPDSQEAVYEAVVLSGITVKKPEENWANYSVFIDTTKSSLVYSKMDSVNTTGIEAKTGSSVATTPFGIVITGQDESGNKKKAWIFNGKSVQSLSDMNEKHVNHSSLFFMSKLLVVSGSYTAAVETYDFHSRNWEPFTALPSKRSFTSLVEHRQDLYLIGGLKAKKQLSKAIFVLKEDCWVKLELKLSEKLAGLGAFVYNKHEVVLFGGFDITKEYNSSIFKLNFRKSECTKITEVEIGMEFSSFPITRFDKQLVAYSNTGQKLLITPKSLKFTIPENSYF